MYSVIGPDGQTYGPVELETLRQWCAEGRINSDTRIVDPIDGDTKRAGDLPEVHQHIRPPSAAATFQRPPFTGFQPSTHNSYLANLYAQPAYNVAPPKSMLVAILLAFFLGALGIHRFYLGHTGTGLAMLLITILSLGAFAIITAIWSLIDLVLIATGSLRDRNDRALTWP